MGHLPVLLLANPPLQARHSLNLDYDALVQPWRCEQTLTGEVYTNRERCILRACVWDSSLCSLRLVWAQVTAAMLARP